MLFRSVPMRRYFVKYQEGRIYYQERISTNWCGENVATLVEDGYQPTESNLNPLKPPQGGSGVLNKNTTLSNYIKRGV